MAMKRTGLGKGLDSLIPTNAPGAKKTGASSGKTSAPSDINEVGEKLVDINKVEPNANQPRSIFDEEALKELSESIRQFGIIQPLVVQDKGKFYEIVAGERRWRAAKLAGLKKVPVIIRDYSEIERMQIALIENIQRENLNPIEEALAYKKLIDEFDLKQEDVANRVSKSRVTITNSMRLLKLDERVQQMLVEGKITTGHARALLTITSAKAQYEAASRVIAQNLSVRETENLVKSGDKSNKKKPAKTKSRTDIIYKDLENRMREAWGTKISINEKSKGKGKIEIEYYSESDLERICDLIISQGSDR